MKQFCVMWTYLGNYSKPMMITAKSPEDAAQAATGFFSADFKEKGNVYVWEAAPVYTKERKRD